jgi:hypothetical protein
MEAIMSKRHLQKPDTTSEFALWLKRNSKLVDASGVPSLIISSEDHWYYFLDHGSLYRFDDDPSDFGTEKLTPLQRAALMRLLMTGPNMMDTLVGRHLIVQLVQDIEATYSGE